MAPARLLAAVTLTDPVTMATTCQSITVFLEDMTNSEVRARRGPACLIDLAFKVGCKKTWPAPMLDTHQVRALACRVAIAPAMAE